MSPEEKPSSDLESDSPVFSDPDAAAAELVSAADSSPEPVEASFADEASGQPEIVDSEIVEAQSIPGQAFYPDASNSIAVSAMSPSMYAPPALAHSFENLAAKGGAVGALVLGIWCFAGSFITNWSIINGLLGLLMGFWGLTSKHKKMAWIGIALCLIGMFLSLVQVSEILNLYLNARDENSFE
jgi:hypothetical protein